MKKSFKFTAKKVDKAIAEGLTTLGVQIDEVEVNIISSGGLFKKAEVEIIITEPDPIVEISKQAPIAIASIAKPVPVAASAKTEQSNNKPLFAKKEEKKGVRLEKPIKQEQQQKVSNQKSQAAKPAFATKFANNSGDSFSGDNSSASSEKDNAPKKLFERKAPVKKEFVERAPRGPATEESQQAAEEFLTTLFRLSDFEATASYDLSDGLKVDISTENSSIIGHRGEALDCLQYLTGLYVNTGKDKYVNVSVDALGYRAKRKDTLQKLAHKMADKCLKNNRRMGLEPMNNIDRKIIHAYLATVDGVVTRSEGQEPNRRIIVYPERKK